MVRDRQGESEIGLQSKIYTEKFHIGYVQLGFWGRWIRWWYQFFILFKTSWRLKNKIHLRSSIIMLHTSVMNNLVI